MNRIHRVGGLLFTALLAVLLASCATEPRNIPYQTSGETQAGQAGAVEALQNSAIEALNQQAYQQAIEYLQRAIRIEPRNPRSWHYLAQTYWQRKDLDRCLEMVERSFSYSTPEDGLDEANRELRARCQPG
jgi:Tfp pilus assembly protein PilF